MKNRTLIDLRATEGNIVYMTLKDNVVLYVGMSVAGLSRPATNPRCREQNPTHLEVIQFETAEEAARAEAWLIQEFNPPCNRASGFGGNPTGDLLKACEAIRRDYKAARPPRPPLRPNPDSLQFFKAASNTRLAQDHGLSESAVIRQLIQRYGEEPHEH